MKKLKTDVVIIGAGPIGLFSVFQCGMMGLKTQIIDSSNIIGGQCTTLYPEKNIYDIPAYKNILSKDLIKNLISQSETFKPNYHLGQNVDIVYKVNNNWNIKTSKNIKSLFWSPEGFKPGNIFSKFNFRSLASI